MSVDPTAHDRYAEWDAAYVLGSLPADERLEYERHLESCPRCTAAVAELVGLPGLLGKLPADQAFEIAEPDGRHDTGSAGTLASVAHRVRHRRRRRRVWVAATAGLAVVAAVLGGLAVGTAGERGAVQAGASPTAAGPGDRYTMTGSRGLDVDLAVSGEQWGTRFDWGCSYGGKQWSSDGSVMYDLVVVRTDGTVQTVASWSAAGAEARGLSASTDIPRDEIATVEVRLRGESGVLADVHL